MINIFRFLIKKFIVWRIFGDFRWVQLLPAEGVFWSIFSLNAVTTCRFVVALCFFCFLADTTCRRSLFWLKLRPLKIATVVGNRGWQPWLATMQPWLATRDGILGCQPESECFERNYTCTTKTDSWKAGPIQDWLRGTLIVGYQDWHNQLFCSKSLVIYLHTEFRGPPIWVRFDQGPP